MDLKKKFEAAKNKIKAHAPELIGVASTLIVGGVLVYLGREKTSRTSYDDLIDYNLESNGVESGRKKFPEDEVRFQTISVEEMSKLLDTGAMTAYTVGNNLVTFYTIENLED